MAGIIAEEMAPEPVPEPTVKYADEPEARPAGDAAPVGNPPEPDDDVMPPATCDEEAEYFARKHAGS